MSSIPVQQQQCFHSSTCATSPNHLFDSCFSIHHSIRFYSLFKSEAFILGIGYSKVSSATTVKILAVKTSHRRLQLFERMLQHCSDGKILLNCSFKQISEWCFGERRGRKWQCVSFLTWLLSVKWHLITGAERKRMISISEYAYSAFVALRIKPKATSNIPRHGITGYRLIRWSSLTRPCHLATAAMFICSHVLPHSTR